MESFKSENEIKIVSLMQQNMIDLLIELTLINLIYKSMKIVNALTFLTPGKKEIQLTKC